MLAIVIPYYKIIYFRETLISLANQTCKNFKVYIGDDASLEDPKDLIEEFKGHFQYKYFRFENNIGREQLTKQWERCIDLAEEEPWLMLLGDDDVLGKTVVEEFYNALNKPNFDSNVVRVATILIDEQNGKQSELVTQPEYETGVEFTMRKLKHETRSSLSEYFFKKEAYLRHRFTHFPTGFYSDDKAWLDFSEEKFIFSINNAIVFIRISDSSLSGSASNKNGREAECLFLLNLYENRFKNFDKKQKILLLNKLENTFYFNNFKNKRILFRFYVHCLLYLNFEQLKKLHKKSLSKLYHSLKF